MSRLIHGSRIFLLGTAFMGVMAGAGGLVGAIGGAVMVLLGRAVMGFGASLIELIPASIAFGALSAMSLGVFLVARPTLRLTWHPRLIAPTPPIEPEQVSPS